MRSSTCELSHRREQPRPRRLQLGRHREQAGLNPVGITFGSQYATTAHNVEGLFGRFHADSGFMLFSRILILPTKAISVARQVGALAGHVATRAQKTHLQVHRLVGGASALGGRATWLGTGVASTSGTAVVSSMALTDAATVDRMVTMYWPRQSQRRRLHQVAGVGMGLLLQGFHQLVGGCPRCSTIAR